MAKQYKVLVNSAAAEQKNTVDVSQFAGDAGQPVRIKAKAGIQYQLQEIGNGKNLAPDYVKVKRKGNDLEITFEKGRAADLIIEDYYTVMPSNHSGLIGQAENGAFYDYLPNDPTAQGLIPELVNGAQPVNVALGGQEITSFGLAALPLVAGFPFGLLGAGVGALALAGAAGGGGSDGGGGTSSGSSTPTIVINGKLAPVSDNTVGVANDNTTNDNTPILSGQAPAGSTANITLNGQTYPVIVDSNGTWTFTQPANLPDGTYNPVLNVTQNGVTTSKDLTPFTIDTTIPQTDLKITIDSDKNNDGFINREELGASTQVDATVTFDKARVKVGDTLTITAGSETKTLTIDAAALAAGKVTTQLTAPAEGERLDVKAVMKDIAGNVSPEVKDTAKRDTSNFGPVDPITSDKNITIVITSDKENDGAGNGVLNATELTGGKINVKVTLSADAKAGDTLVIEGTGNNTQTVTLSPEQVAAKAVLTQFDAPANGTNFTATAQLSDIAQNVSNKVSDSALINTSLPGAPVVVISEDLNSDGFINRTELNGDIGVNVKATSAAVVGDTLSVTDGTTVKTFVLDTQAKVDAAKTAGIDTTFAAPADGSTFNVSATLKVGASGNISNPDTDSAKLDLTDFSKVDPTDATKHISAVGVNIDTDADNSTIISAAELKGTGEKIKVTLTLPTGAGTAAVAGDTLTVKASGNADRVIVLTQADIDAGKVVISDYNSTGDNTTFTVTASIKDQANNASPTPDASDSATIRSTIAGAPVVTITEDGNDNGVINATELSGKVGVLVGIPSAAKAGDTLKIVIGGQEENIVLTAEQIKDGSITREVDAPANGQTLIATAQLIDIAGQTSPVGDDKAVINTTIPNGGKALDLKIETDGNNDGFINRVELNGSKTVSVSAGFEPTLVAVGDVVTITDGTTTKTIAIDAAAITAKKVTTTFDAPAEGKSIEVKATLKNANDNATPEAKDTAARDTIEFKNLALEITTADISGDSNLIRLPELEQDKGTIKVKVTLPDGLKSGDLLLVTGTGNAPKSIVIKPEDITAKEVVVEFTPLFKEVNGPDSNGYEFTATAQIGDAAGNVSGIAADQSTINTQDLGGPLVTIDEDKNNDGFISPGELSGATIKVIVKSGVVDTKAGEKIILTFPDGTTKELIFTADNLTSGFVETYTLSDNEKANGSLLNFTASANTQGKDVFGSDTAIIDRSDLSGLKIAITTDAGSTGGDGIITASELVATSNKIAVKVSLPAGAVAGDFVTINGSGNISQTVVLTQEQITAKVVTVVFNPTADGTDFIAKATIQDLAGNISNTAEDKATINLPPASVSAPSETVADPVDTPVATLFTMPAADEPSAGLLFEASADRSFDLSSLMNFQATEPAFNFSNLESIAQSTTPAELSSAVVASGLNLSIADVLQATTAKDDLSSLLQGVGVTQEMMQLKVTDWIDLGVNLMTENAPAFEAASQQFQMEAQNLLDQVLASSAFTM